MTKAIAQEESEMVLQLLKKIMPVDSPPLEFAAARCLWRRLYYCGCRRCVEVCRSGALSLCGDQISLDQAACTACMRCSAVCPNDALIAAPDLYRLLDGMDTDEEVLFSCVRQPRLQGERYTLSCLGQFTDEALIAIALQGPRSVVFNVAACHGCTNRESATAAINALERITAMLQPLMRAKITLLQSGHPEFPAETANRRDFLTGLTGKIRSSALRAIVGPSPVNPESHDNRRRIPWRRRLLLQVEKSLDFQGKTQLREICNPRLRRNENCELCPSCAGICPSGALRLEEDDGERLLFDGRLCSSCGLCVTFCRKGALLLIEAPIFTGTEDLAVERGINPAENPRGEEEI
ncbi:MAG: 4Fe-4S binding protein [Desulfopila sp.]